MKTMKINLNIPGLYSTATRATLRLTTTIIWSLCLLGIALLGLFALPVTQTQADGPDTAYIVIQFDEHTAIVRPISFTTSISGLAALEMTGLDIITSATGFGPAVCTIETVGNPATACFGAGFWSYAFWNGSDWESYQVGADSSTIGNGAIELWAWSPGFVSPPSPGSGPQFISVAKATHWLAGQQSTSNGGYGNVGNSLEVMMAIGANGYRSADWQHTADGPSLFGYVLANGAGYSTNGVAATGKLAVGLSAAGSCYPYRAVYPSDTYIAATGIYTSGYGVGAGGAQSWGILGTQALSQTVPATATTYLKSIINADGGWGWTGDNSDTNATSLAIQALVAAGEPVSSSTIISGLTYLKSAQNNDGGFAYDPASNLSTSSDTNSTAYVVQAIRAAGQDPLTGTWIISSTNPISYLLGMQQSDGSFEWQPGFGPSQLATQQTIPALLGRYFPVRTANVAACKTSFLPLTIK